MRRSFESMLVSPHALLSFWKTCCPQSHLSCQTSMKPSSRQASESRFEILNDVHRTVLAEFGAETAKEESSRLQYIRQAFDGSTGSARCSKTSIAVTISKDSLGRSRVFKSKNSPTSFLSRKRHSPKTNKGELISANATLSP